MKPEFRRILTRNREDASPSDTAFNSFIQLRSPLFADRVTLGLSESFWSIPQAATLPEPKYEASRHIILTVAQETIQNSIVPRVLGLDVGSKTIGMAVSDPLGITAQGLKTLRRKNKRVDFSQLQDVIRDYSVSEIVVGYPLRMSGMEGTQSQKMEQFAEELRSQFKLPVHLWDERLTSAEANRVLRDSEMSIKRRGEVVDRLAAVLILQSWMDARAGGR